MIPEQVRLVQQSFARIQGDGAALARTFYARLFEIDPSTKPLFTSPIATQEIKLIAMLALVVQALDRLDPLLPMIGQLGRRHVRYGVAERHYPSVGAALLWSLDQRLGAQFTPDVRAAWVAAYGLLSTTMMGAARVEAADAAMASPHRAAPRRSAGERWPG